MDSTSPYHPSSTEHLPHVERREPSSGTQGELLLELEDVHDQGELVQVARMYKTHKTENNRQTSDVWSKQSMFKLFDVDTAPHNASSNRAQHSCIHFDMH
jgi:hypothetical protein